VAQIGLDTPLKGLIGARTANRIADKLDLATVGDLLRYYPRKYDQRGKLTDLAKLVVGERATVWGRVVKVTERDLGFRGPNHGRGRGKGGGRPPVKHITNVIIGDSNRQLTCTFFNQYHWAKALPPGPDAMFSGKITTFQNKMQMSSPTVAVLSDTQGTGPRDESDLLEIIESFPGGVIPVYPLVEGLTQVVLQQSVRTVLDLRPTIDDPVPEVLLAEHGLIDLATALRDIHRPRNHDHLAKAQERLRYDEALAVQLVLARRRADAKRFPAEPCPRVPGGLLDAFDAALPFELTDGQREVGETIAADLATIHPMNRLLQGEVGSGKTVVALRAMLQVIDSGRQAVMLAPTEVLAAQHARSLRDVLGPLGRGGELGAPAESTAITLLTGSLGAKARKQALLNIASGQAGIVVGTHALLSEGVFFANLGLIVVDEQHRFGVEQRAALTDKAGWPPHVLVMTATPIPRTVAMTVFGDLETSVLTELPAGRAPIQTTVVPLAEQAGWLDRAWQRVREEVEAGHQVYVVCPRITGDEKEQGEQDTLEYDEDGNALEDKRSLTAVTELAPSLASGPLHGLRVEMLHGRMPADEKDRTMRAFAAGDIDVLVATTVIEVGVDVANATVMVLMDADRFGVSQLHQLRGRVGRGGLPGLCLLVTGPRPAHLRASAWTPWRPRPTASSCPGST
jgi:ATP-dependent DNA helicase RecG